MSSLNMPDRPGLCLIFAAALVAGPAVRCAPAHSADSFAVQCLAAPEQDPKRTKTDIDRLVGASAKELPAHLKKFITDNMRMGTFYRGQYDVLRRCAAPPTPWLLKWIERPPGGVYSREHFRTACMRALRDVHPKKPPKDLLPALHTIARDEEEPSEVRKEAVYILAGFGDRKPIEELVAIQKKNVDASDPRRQVSGLIGLADIHYRLSEYKAAANLQLEAIAIYEKGSVVASRGMQTCYYNAACFLAMAGDSDPAFVHLKKALNTGKAFSRRALELDRDLRPLHPDPRFKKLLDDYFATRPTRGVDKSGKEADKKKKGVDKGKKDVKKKCG